MHRKLLLMSAPELIREAELQGCTFRKIGQHKLTLSRANIIFAFDARSGHSQLDIDLIRFAIHALGLTGFVDDVETNSAWEPSEDEQT